MCHRLSCKGVELKSTSFIFSVFGANNFCASNGNLEAMLAEQLGIEVHGILGPFLSCEAVKHLQSIFVCLRLVYHKLGNKKQRTNITFHKWSICW